MDELDELSCDICNDPNVRWRYPCPRVKLPTVAALYDDGSSKVLEQYVEGDWGVCDACSDLIESRAFSGIFDRSSILRRISPSAGEAFRRPWTEFYKNLVLVHLGPRKPYVREPGDGTTRIIETSGPSAQRMRKEMEE